MFKRICRIIRNSNIIPNTQYYIFAFRDRYSTIHQINHYNGYSNKENNNCITSFFVVTLAFDRVQHPSLLFKIKNFLPSDFFILFKSYISIVFNWQSDTKVNSATSIIQTGFSQGVITSLHQINPLLFTFLTLNMMKIKQFCQLMKIQSLHLKVFIL